MGNIKIGLEIHMHLRTKEKLFCTCKIPEQNSPINTTICERCTGQPGAKPMLPNKTAIAHVIKLALIFNSSITKTLTFKENTTPGQTCRQDFSEPFPEDT